MCVVRFRTVIYYKSRLSVLGTRTLQGWLHSLLSLSPSLPLCPGLFQKCILPKQCRATGAKIPLRNHLSSFPSSLSASDLGLEYGSKELSGSKHPFEKTDAVHLSLRNDCKESSGSKPPPEKSDILIRPCKPDPKSPPESKPRRPRPQRRQRDLAAYYFRRLRQGASATGPPRIFEQSQRGVY